MLSTACPGFHKAALSRRHLLQLGGFGLLGLSLPGLLRAEAAGSTKARARSVILLHQYGGPSQFETFDMKPNAPEAIRGLWKPIPTKVPGIQICEHLPRMAPLADKLTLIRTLTHEMKNHNSAGYYSLTGYPPPTDDQRLRDSLDLSPAYGSIVDRLAPSKAGLPTFVSYPHVMRDGSITPGQHASFLGKKHDPLFFTNDPNGPDFRLPELSLPDKLTLERLESRKQVLDLIDYQTRLQEYSSTAKGIDENYQRALSMLASPQVKKAFDLSAESSQVRDRYGRTTYGQGCLLARRLVEAGVRFVNVYFAESIGGQSTVSGGWDTHGFNSKSCWPVLKDYLLPVANQTLPTLIEDLDARGLLDTTLVIWMGEFGRTPRVNANPGRDHWPQCYTVLLAGGGVKRGHVHGISDKTGAYPASDPVRPEDLAATIFHLLGLDPHTEIHDALNKPIPIAKGSVLTGVVR
jgi:hypothetical protein